MSKPIDAATPEGREELRRLFIMKKTEIRYLAKRGYVIFRSFITDGTESSPFDPARFSSLSFEEFLQLREQSGLFSTRESFSSIYNYSLNNVTGNQVVLYIGNSPGKLSSKDNCTMLYNAVSVQEFGQIIAISKSGFHYNMVNYVREQTAGKNIQLFTDSDFAFDRSQYCLAPIVAINHPPSSVPEYEKTEGLNKRQLPFILSRDIIAKILGAQPDSIIEMVISGADANKIGYYRYVRETNQK